MRNVPPTLRVAIKGVTHPLGFAAQILLPSTWSKVPNMMLTTTIGLVSRTRQSDMIKVTCHTAPLKLGETIHIGLIEGDPTSDSNRGATTRGVGPIGAVINGATTSI